MDKQYNMFLRNYITLKDGERFCEKCKGRGKVPKMAKPQGTGTAMLVCNECLGDGKIDWVEEVLGKKRKVFYGESITSKM